MSSNQTASGTEQVSGAGHSSDDHHIVISADTHCGADVLGYRPYLDGEYRDEFDDWAAFIEEDNRRRAKMFEGMERTPLEVGVDGDPDIFGYRNSSSEKRLREQEEDGVIAAVLFPNTQPPFSPPAATSFEAPPYSDNFEHRWAGLRAHNRWLADFVSEAPQRRAGIIQIFLGDVEGSVQEIEWAAEQGLTGGILVPGAPPDSPFEPLYSARYEPIWAAAAAANLPLNHHAGGASPNFGNHFPASLAMFMLEVQWWTQRALWHLMFSGVFERYPDLPYVITETGTAWVPDTLKKLDSFHHRMKFSKYGSESIFGGQAVAQMSLTPTEYFDRQCYIGASFLRPAEGEATRAVGVERIMWGSDYPHIEGSYPHTHEHLRLTFAQMTREETTAMLTDNAARIYGFDLDALRPLAEQFCPTKDYVANPIDYSEIPERAKGCPGMNPLNQVREVA
jgi:predicted TIM-barrel fold metal-dependent hydrolase